MNDKMKRICKRIILVLWMILIFMFSTQSAEESGAISDGICYKLISGADQVLPLDLEEEQVEQFAQDLELPVRKLAHMTEYGILAILVVWNLTGFSLKSCLVAFLFAILYAMTDEYHQTFVPGRSGNLVDVCIDGTGAGIGLIIGKIFHRGRQHQQKSGQKKTEEQENDAAKRSGLERQCVEE